MSSEIEQLELSIEEAQKIVDRRNQLDKLFSNREFKKVVLEGLFEEEIQRLVGLLGDTGMKPHRDEITLELQSISKLRAYFQRVKQFGDMAEQSIKDDQEALADVRAELAGELADEVAA